MIEVSVGGVSLFWGLRKRMFHVSVLASRVSLLASVGLLAVFIFLRLVAA